MDLSIEIEIDMSTNPNIGAEPILVANSIVDLPVAMKTIYIYDFLAHKTKNKPFKRERDIMCLGQILLSLLE